MDDDDRTIISDDYEITKKYEMVSTSLSLSLFLRVSSCVPPPPPPPIISLQGTMANIFYHPGKLAGVCLSLKCSSDVY